MKNRLVFLCIVLFVSSQARCQHVKVPNATYLFDCSLKTEPVSKSKQPQRNLYVIIRSNEELTNLTNCTQDYVFDFDKYILIGINGSISGCGRGFALFDVVKDTVQKKYIASVFIPGNQGNCKGMFSYRTFVKIEKPSQDYDIDFNIVSTSDKYENDITSYIFLRGSVTNSVTQQYVGVKITVQDINTPEKIYYAYSNPNNSGYYYLYLPRSSTYKISVTQDSLFYSEKLDLLTNADSINDPEYGNAFIEKNIELHPLTKDEKIVLNNIYFETGKYDLKEGNYSELETLLQLIKSYPNIVVEISGHTDNVGNSESNLLLSEKRAEAVAEYLIKAGISRTQIIVKGYGSAQPISDNDTEEGRGENRRIEFRIIEI